MNARLSWRIRDENPWRSSTAWSVPSWSDGTSSASHGIVIRTTSIIRSSIAAATSPGASLVVQGRGPGGDGDMRPAAGVDVTTAERPGELARGELPGQAAQ